MEQIDKAIEAIEKEVDDFQGLLSKYPAPKLPVVSKAIKPHLQKYKDQQKELNLLNSYAVRVNALRKELIRTEMRVRYKNNFFQRLSAAGDKIFPRRKGLIKEISRLFVDDVEAFIKGNFSSMSTDKPVYHLFDEIKSLQTLAKFFTLNTNAFTHTRFRLSECWDKLREKEKEIKAENIEKKQVFQKNEEQVKQKIEEFSGQFSEGKISLGDAQKQLDDISKFMRSVELGRHEVKTLREALNSSYTLLKEKLKEEEKKKRELELAKEQKKQEKVETLETAITELVDGSENKNCEELVQSLESIQGLLTEVEVTEFEKDSLIRRLTPIKDRICELEEEQMLELSANNEEACAQLEQLHERLLERRAEIKAQMDRYRKASGGSGLDFEQSLYYNEQLNLEKARLEKLNASVQKVERKLQEVKK